MNCIQQDGGENWHAYNGDCCDVARGIPDDSVGFSVLSPPFSSLYTYSNSERDMGNCKDNDSFFRHFGFLVDSIFAATMPGRLFVWHDHYRRRSARAATTRQQ